MAQFGYLQAGIPGFYSLFRREVFIRRNLIFEGMLLDSLSIDFGRLRSDRILPDAFLDTLILRHWDTFAHIYRDGLRIRR